MQFQVSPEIVNPIIKDQVAAAVAAHLGDPKELVLGLVQRALEQKVDSDGNRSRYSSDNKHSFLEAMAGKAIREAARAALDEIIAEQQPVITRAVRRHLEKAPDDTAAAIVSAFAQGCGNRYNTKINISFQPE